MLISIIIPVFNDVNGLQVTLESIKRHLGSRKDIEIIVCNDGGVDKISKIAAAYDVNEVRLKEKKGSYAARNKGINASKGEILAFLDADQQITENWLDAGVSSLNNADYAGGYIKINTGENPSIWELADEKIAFPVKEYLDSLHFAPTANLFIHKKVMVKVGNFNEIFRSGGDRDFGVRVFDNGFRQIYVPEAVTLHPARNRAEQILKQKRTAIGYAELALFVQNKNNLSFILWAFSHFILVPIEMMWRPLRYPFFDYWKNDKIDLRIILIKKLLKLIYFWNLIIRAIQIAILT